MVWESAYGALTNTLSPPNPTVAELNTPAGSIYNFLVTPSGLPTWARIAIGIVAESLFLAYVFVVGRAAVRDGVTGDVLGSDAGETAPATAA